MKKIINGKRYDTNTAKELGYYEYSNRRDFHHWEETLYRKNTGEYFLHGVGGAMSRYAESCGQNEWCGGEKIIPLTLEAAQKWAEEYLDADEYEKIFTVSDEKHTATFSLSESTIEAIKKGASAAGISLSDYIERCVKNAGD